MKKEREVLSISFYHFSAEYLENYAITLIY